MLRRADNPVSVTQGDNHDGLMVGVNNGTINNTNVKLVVIDSSGAAPSDFREVLREKLGKDISPEALDEIFNKCYDYIKEKGESPLGNVFSQLPDWLENSKQQLKKDLYRITHDKYIVNTTDVLHYARRLHELSPDDVLAEFYVNISEYSKSPDAINDYIAKLDVCSCGDKTLSEMLDYLIKMSEPRMVNTLIGLVNRAQQEKVFSEAKANKYTKLCEKIKPWLSVEEYDIFIAYSQKDIEEVKTLVSELDKKGYHCFAAYRDLPLTSGDNYWTRLKQAMKNSRGLVFVSTPNSRSYSCNTFTIPGVDSGELPYFNENFPEKFRIEYRLDDSNSTPPAIKTFLTKFFGTVNYCRKIDDVCSLVDPLVHPQLHTKPKKEPPQPKAPKVKPEKDHSAEEIKGKPWRSPNYPTLKNYDKNEFDIEDTVLKKYKGKAQNVEIPYGVTSITDYAFEKCYSPRSVVIPAGVTSIGHGAFRSCSNLKSITIPNGVKSIGNSAFSGCSDLTSITIPDGIKSIGDYAFYGCSNLTSITIPGSVTRVGRWAFSICNKELMIYCKAKKRPKGWHGDWNRDYDKYVKYLSNTNFDPPEVGHVVWGFGKNAKRLHMRWKWGSR